MHKLVRHPNYLGEMPVYGSFAMVVRQQVLVLAWVWIGVFAVNMLMKDASRSRYAERPPYSRRTWWLIPRGF